MILTFFIVLFILLMQFLWRYVDDIVGKGLDTIVVIEFFVYAAGFLVPMALPLSILLASIMTFGNLGEQLELLSMKAAGISLFKIMKPLIILVIFISIGAFFFSNEVFPIIQRRFHLLKYDIQQQNPELNIKEHVFNSDLEGYSVRISGKNRETGMLYKLMIYDHTNGNDNNSLTLADSGKIETAGNKQYMVLTLYHGHSYVKSVEKGKRYDEHNRPFRQDEFDMREVLIEINSLERTDESILRNNYLGKNIATLQRNVDSLQRMNNLEEKQFYSSLKSIKGSSFRVLSNAKVVKRQDSTILTKSLNPDSLFCILNPSNQKEVVKSAIKDVRKLAKSIEQKTITAKYPREIIRKHYIELHKKFTLSFACFIFFFIGAPLGSIIRKGGFGVPVVLSILLFIIYYILDSFGHKFAIEGVVNVFVGVWASSIILLVIGVFLTYKAVTDSVLMNTDNYKKTIVRLFSFFKKKGEVEIKNK